MTNLIWKAVKNNLICHLVWGTWCTQKSCILDVVISFITETGSNIFKWGNAVRYSFKVKQSTALFWLRVLPLNKPFVIQACEHMACNWWLFSVSCHRWWPADRLPQSISHRFQLINAAKISRTEERKLPRECERGGEEWREREREREREEQREKEWYIGASLLLFFFSVRGREWQAAAPLPAEQRTEDFWETCNSNINLRDMWEKYQLRSAVKMMTDFL